MFRNKNYQDLIGQVFDRWEILQIIYVKGGHTEAECKCKCGTVRNVRLSRLRSGKSRSCGCLIGKTITHGMARTQEYNIWCHIKNRCYNENLPHYKDYGGRGIKVCERWLESFENFYEDIGPRPSKDYSIDRIDNNGDYCKENCRWATWSEQANNKRRITVLKGDIPYFGVSKYKSKYRAILNYNKKRIDIGVFDNAIDAAKAYDDKYEEIFGIRRNYNYYKEL